MTAVSGPCTRPSARGPAILAAISQQSPPSKGLWARKTALLGRSHAGERLLTPGELSHSLFHDWAGSPRWDLRVAAWGAAADIVVAPACGIRRAGGGSWLSLSPS